MKKTVTAVILLSILAAVTAFGQWQDLGIFPKAGLVKGDTIHYSIHGLAVDPDGKIWVQSYYAYPEDSILIPNYGARVGNGTTITDSIVSIQVAVRALYIYNPNGTQASFSPMKFVKVNGIQDTLGGRSLQAYTGAPWLWTSSSADAGVGLRADQDGNILACYRDKMYRINYKTGAGMNKALVNSARASITSPGVDDAGYVYVNRVVSGATPLLILNPDLTFLQNAVDTLDPNSYSRATEVSKDGNDIYFAGYTDRAIYRYRSPASVLGTFSVVDTILKGFHTESIGWNHKKSGTNAYLWASCGSYNDQPNDWPGLTTSYTPGTWYAIDTTGNGSVKDSINWTFFIANDASERPRAIAFSPGGDTAWVGVFGLVGHGNPSLRMYKRAGAANSVQTLNTGIPATYALEQNYPNPFNPSTEIQFKVAKAGMTTLKVYDIIGREVSTLVNQNMNAGTFTVKLDGSKLATGTYIYTLTSGDARITKKMMLLK